LEFDNYIVVYVFHVFFSIALVTQRHKAPSLMLQLCSPNKQIHANSKTHSGILPRI